MCSIIENLTSTTHSIVAYGIAELWLLEVSKSSGHRVVKRVTAALRALLLIYIQDMLRIQIESLYSWVRRMVAMSTGAVALQMR